MVTLLHQETRHLLRHLAMEMVVQWVVVPAQANLSMLLALVLPWEPSVAHSHTVPQCSSLLEGTAIRGWHTNAALLFLATVVTAAAARWSVLPGCLEVVAPGDRRPVDATAEEAVAATDAAYEQRKFQRP